jgi:GNAT superfamily N-acetyltransferase
VSVEVVRTYLELNAPAELRPALVVNPRLRLDHVVDCPISFYRYLYAEVGKNHHWVDRLPWTDEEVRAYLDSPDVNLWVLSFEGAPAGYFELRRCEDGSTEIAYFGLLPEFKGRGFGKHLLTVAAQTAWAAGARRVWLHTCTLDDPAALPNYEKRGFSPFKQETYWVDS